MIPALAIGGAAWIVLSAVGGVGWSFAVGRIKARAAEFTDWSLWQPEVPQIGEDDDAEWLEVWPTAEETEQAIFDRLFAAIPEVAADLRAQS